MKETTNNKNIKSIRDNFSNGSVGNFLVDNIENDSNLSFVTAYFTIYAYEKLKPQLDNIKSLKLLFGEPRFLKSVSSTVDAKNYRIEDDKLVIPVENRLQQKVLARQCSDWIRNKVEIKSMVRPDFLHGKLYHIEKQNGLEDAVTGSSNFTVNGLGLGSRPNIELNLVVNDRRDLADLKEWFDKLWNNEMDEVEVEDVKDQVLKYIELLHSDYSPEFVYYKTLYHIFGQYIDETDTSGLSDIKANLYDTQIWKELFAFQQHGVRGAINKILKYNGCIIADSVGLGKTYEALAVIKYFEMLNYRVLVLSPKKLRDNWTVYQAHKNNTLNPFPQDRFSYTVMYHTDLSREKGFTEADNIDLSNFNWGAYDLVVIDESHNFRNNKKGKKDEEGNTIRKSRYERLMQDIILSGKKTKVLLLSATPVNNELKDLRNQLMYITAENDNAYAGEDEGKLGIESIAELLKQSQLRFTNWAKARIKEEKTTSDLLNNLDSAFFKLLDALTIARSRKHIIKYYAKEMKRIGGFPEHEPVHSIYPEIDTEHKFLSYDKLNEKISNYKLVHFSPSAFVLPEHKAWYEEKVLKKSGPAAVKMFSQEQRESYLIGMMKVNFMKRLESSIYSFRETLKRTVARIENLEKRIERFQKYKEENSDIEIEDIDIDAIEDDELREALEVGEKLTFKMNHLKLDEWKAAMSEDKDQLYELLLRAKDVDAKRDAKLKELKSLIKKKVNNPTTTKTGTENKKVIIFTAFADTAKYLYNNLELWAKEELKVNIALVTGGNENKTTFRPKGFLENTEFNHILTNFSPISKKRSSQRLMPKDEDGEIDILIATDCISEGQNLQDCDYLVNYDIHWNPVRIIQRFGRIDRIGSINNKVQLVNFWPTKDLDNYIKLKSRVEARMALVDISGTNEDNLLNKEQIKDLVEDELKFRDKQLKRLQDEVLDMDELNEGGVSLSNFSLDDFRMDLLNFIEANRKELEAAPLGIYALVPYKLDSTLFNQDVSQVVKPGVIFCLGQLGDSEGNDKVNPLQPNFLVYVCNDGTVRYNFTHPKQILDIYRLLCSGKDKPIQQLCDLFNEETNNGLDTSQYAALLSEAIKAITTTFKKKNLGMLSGSRSATIIPQAKQLDGANKFELINWLVLK
ncbi:MAG: NgoFVII family restriction endonuclease [Bacteroidetes bacterium]|nr:NgoFVII family restriction endonuclease [Bacteroidota bacterium]